LSKLFNDLKIEGLLIGSPVCEIDERLQIDALLITQNVVCIIDFKNYEGKIILPDEKNFELGLWRSFNGEHIKGGAYINPYIQLKNQKAKFDNIFNNFIKSNLSPGDRLNPKHIVLILCFQKEVAIDKEIPKSKELFFFLSIKKLYRKYSRYYRCKR